MQDNFEREFAERVKVVFEDYDDGLAGMGWEKLQQRIKHEPKMVQSSQIRRQPRRLLWLSTAAATLLVAGVWAWTALLKQDTPYVVSSYNKPVKERLKERLREPADHPLQAENTDKAEILSSDKAPHQTIATTSKERSFVDDVVKDHDNNAPVLASALHVESGSSDIAGGVPSPLLARITETVEQPKRAIPVISPDQEKATGNLAAVSRPGTTNVTKSDKSDAFSNSDDHHKQVAERLAALSENQHQAAEIMHGNQQRISVGVTAGSFVNYAEGSKATVNPSMGIQSELKLSKKLRFATGVMLAQNNLSYNSSNSANAASEIMAAAAPVHMNSELQISNLTNRVQAYDYSLNGYNVSLLGLDIPLNLKYLISDNKNDLFVSAGLSSNYFFREDYEYRYTTSTYNGQSTNSRLSNQASSFNFGRMLNFSVGMGYPLGKQNKLSVEPYVKYPLGTQTTEDLRFGSAGINLRFNIGR